MASLLVRLAADGAGDKLTAVVAGRCQRQPRSPTLQHVYYRFVKGPLYFLSSCVKSSMSKPASVATRSELRWDIDADILTQFSSLAALKVVILTTFRAVSNENYDKMTTFSLQCYGIASILPVHCWIYFRIYKFLVINLQWDKTPLNLPEYHASPRHQQEWYWQNSSCISQFQNQMHISDGASIFFTIFFFYKND